MSGRLAPGLAIDELAVPGEERIVLRLARGRDQLVFKTESAHLLHRMGAEIDADAERAQLGRGLEYADAGGSLGGVKGERQRQPADTAANDDDVHETLVS
jgi:hypothetical protein